MVRPGAHRGDDNLGPVTDRTGRVESRVVTVSSIVPGIYYDPRALGSSTQPPCILFRTRPPPSLNCSYTPIPYDLYGSSQAPPTSYDPYAHAPTLPFRVPGQDFPHCRSKTQVPLNEVSGRGLQLGVQFFENLVSSVPVNSSYNIAKYEATDYGNPSSDAGLGRDSMMSKIAGSRQKRSKKSRPPTNPMQRKKAKNDNWEQTGPVDGGPLDLVLIPSYSGHIASNLVDSLLTLHLKSIDKLYIQPSKLKP
ncbi:hypothetical protein M9H77_13463 [Catharanthus roseus]|uniref:Uncharacterized protein n=1 Tax=Catharanthus roseus TaxID=4058 RepID=A0ACC0BK74_CATRO|nr:hypothetical protein M9H77_13463 [Catharanthus roseus]